MRLTPRMVERLWNDYRRLEADLRADAEAERLFDFGPRFL